MLISKGITDTNLIAKKLSPLLQSGDVLTLVGDLGAGKTTFTKCIAKELGITETVTSPTFNLLKIYETGRLDLYHMDLYRIESDEMDLEFEDYLYGNGVCIIEWPKYKSEIMVAEYLEINIKYKDDSTREFHFKASGSRYESLLKEVLECMD